MVAGIVPAEHLPQWLGEPIDNASSLSGLPSDQIRLLVCLLAALPLGWLHRLVNGATMKHVFSIVFGAFFCWFVVGNTAWCVPVSALVVWVLVQIVPRTIAPVVVFVAMVSWLSSWHIWRLYVDYMGWSLDATMILMIWTVKASTFAYNVADGQALNAGLKLSERESTLVFRSERALTKIPNLLEYFSYVFFFGGVLVGPCFEAKEYFDFIDGSVLKKHKLPGIPNTILASLKCVGLGLLMYIGMIIAGMYPIMGFVSTDAFGNMPFLAKFSYFWISITSSRFKYYFAWCLGEAGCVATGFGLSGVNRSSTGAVESYQWDRVTNCHMLAVETAPHMTDVTNNWNMGVNNWLKNYVYFRVDAPRFIVKLGVPSKTFTNLVTKATSAFWHGFYPSYYLFFLGAWLAGEMDDAMRASFEGEVTPEARKARAKSWWKGPVNFYELCSFFLSTTVLNFWGICFVLLRADHAYQFGKNMYFMGIWLPIVVTIVCRTMFRRKRAKKDVAAAATPAAAATAATSATVSPSSPQTAAAEVAKPVVVEEEESTPKSSKPTVRRTRSNKAE